MDVFNDAEELSWEEHQFRMENNWANSKTTVEPIQSFQLQTDFIKQGGTSFECSPTLGLLLELIAVEHYFKSDRKSPWVPMLRNLEC